MIIREDQLNSWVQGNSHDAEVTIVELILRLVSASCPHPNERRFSLVVNQPGPDGVLDTSTGFPPFVPVGRSYWEIGTGDNARDKATGDYRKRTQDTPAEERLKSTFTFVTPLSAVSGWHHTWKPDGQRSWVDERLKLDEWRSVQVIDGTILVDWMRQWPAVALWMARKMGLTLKQAVVGPDQRWELLRSYGDPPPLPASVFLTNRESILPKLEAVFDGSIQRLKLQSHYRGQAADFVSAWIETLAEERKLECLSSCLIVSSADLRDIVESVSPRQVIVSNGHLEDLENQANEIIQRATQRHLALICESLPGGLPDPMAVELPNPKSYHIREALEKAGHPEERARVIAQKCDGNLEVLKNLLQNLSTTPGWAQQTEAAQLAIAQMLGSLRESSPADIEISEKMSGKTFGEWIGSLQALVTNPDTPLIHRNGIWRVTSRYEVWHSLGRRIFDADLDRFRGVCLTVLGEPDPQFQLDKDERYAASVHGKVLAHSSALRRGMATTLALLGSYPAALSSCSTGKAEITAALTVRELLRRADWLRWASLNDLLPLLAEASPVEFLSAVEDAVNANPSPFKSVFGQEGGGVFGRNYTTGLLWALETLAWEPDYLSRVTVILGELAQIDPGGSWDNRPINSLTTIYLSWHPQTCASVKQRITALETLCRELPAIGWKLLLSLLPSTHQRTMGTRKPEWRPSIPEDYRLTVTHADYREQVFKYSELALEAAKSDSQKLLDLIERLPDLQPPVGDRLLEHLSAESTRSIAEADRVKIWTEISSLIARHKKYADAEWAMKGERLKMAEEVASALAPQSPFYRHQRLFTDRDFDLIEERGDFDEQQRVLEGWRESAIKEVFESSDADAIFRFARVVESPWKAGFAAGAVGGLGIADKLLPAYLESTERSLTLFCGGYVRGRFYKDSWTWVDSMKMSEWSAAQTGILLAYLPFAQETWDRAKALLGPNEKDYWSRTTANAHEAKTNVSYGIERLLETGRPFAAIQCLSVLLFRKEQLDWRQIVHTLEVGSSSGEPPYTMDVYSIVELIKYLQTNPDAEPIDLMKIEWAYLPLLDEYHQAEPRFLEQRLADEPDFFCEIIRMVFRSTKEPDSESNPSADQVALARNAYRLLDGWKTLPGTKRDGEFDGARLKEWMAAVKDSCEKSGHLRMAEQRIGHVFIHAPSDPDGSWIHHDVAEELNAKDAEQTRIGFRIGLFNSRGMTVSSAGNEESELALTYRERANQLEARGLHRLAQTIRDLASEYDQMAVRESAEDHLDELT